MKERVTRKYKSYRLYSNAEKDKRQRQKAWMLHDNGAVHKISSENIQILETCEGTIADHNSCFTFFSDYNCSTLVLFIVYVPISLILLSPVKCSDRGKSDESS